MYKVAIVQNESEMKRYSWADIRSMFSHFSYVVDNYSIDNIESLFINLLKYDAIIVASNALNDSIIKQNFYDNQNIIKLKDFLLSGKGLFIGFQQKLLSYDFLPEGYHTFATQRNPSDFASGNLLGNENSFPQIFSYPNKFTISDIENHCKNNNLVKGLFWVSFNNFDYNNYDVCISGQEIDSTVNYPLLIISKNKNQNRIVLSSIAFDWQQHQSAWQNIIKYVVEGEINTCFISKKNKTSFDFRALTQLSEYEKIPISKYEIINLDKKNIDYNLYSTFILDCSWDLKDVLSLIKSCDNDILAGAKRFFYFDNSTSLPILNVASNVREYQSFIDKGIECILALYNRNNGLWNNSFWCTLDVFKFFRQSNISIEPFQQKLIDYIFTGNHYRSIGDSQGSYDNVMGATCGMLEIFYALKDFSEQCRNSIESTISWICKNFDSKAFFEKATVLNTFIDLELTDKLINLNHHIQQFVEYFCKSELNSMSYTEIYRYYKTFFNICLRIDLIVNIDIDTYKQLMSKFYRFIFFNQDSTSGKFENTYNTAAMIELILLFRQVQLKNQTNKYKFIQSFEHQQNIFKSLMKAIFYLRTKCDSYFTKDFSTQIDVTTLVKCITSWSMFEKTLQLPLDVVKNSLISENYSNQNLTTFKIDIAKNLSLQENLNNLEKQLASCKINLAHFEHLESEVPRLKNKIQQFKLAISYGILSVIAGILITLSVVYNWTILTTLILPILSAVYVYIDKIKQFWIFKETPNGEKKKNKNID